AVAVPPQPLEFRHLGCYVDGADGNRDLVGLQGVKTIRLLLRQDDTTTVQPDVLLRPISLLWVQSTAYCCCSSAYGSHGIAPAGDCSSACSGNSSQICGGVSRNSIYELTYSPIGPVMPKLPVTSLPNITASESSVTHRSIAASSAVECAAICYSSPDCQGCAFVPSSRMCRLLRFAAVPAEVASEAEEVWMKQ
uniref:Apple domain-containing protein n=1 Tax=Macrostomum lignano TaxID=282301 RepID=A0A1I8GBL5_9PLAT